MTLSVCISSNRAPKYTRQKLRAPRKISECTILVGDVNTPLSETNRSSKQKVSKNIVEFKNTIHQLDKMDLYGPLHPKAAENIPFSNSYETFTKMEHTLGHKTHCNIFKRTEIIQYML